MMQATARAHANIALVKYWGKRDEHLILPTNASLSLTLDGLYTTTTVTVREDLASDVFVRDGAVREGAEAERVTAFLDRVRALAGTHARLEVRSVNDVPTAAGLASSASGFAALAAAAAAALGLDLDDASLSRLARQGSGSACRSIYGGFAEWTRGERADGLDSHGVPIAPPEHWDLRMLVTVLDAAPKKVPSRDGMRETVASSVFYPGWLASVERDLAAVRRAIAERDFPLLGATMEASALKMHATTLGAARPFLYWSPATLALWRTVEELREAGVAAYCTMDAGPNVKVLVQPQDAEVVAAALRAVPGVVDLIACAPGPGVAVLETAKS